MVAPIQSVDPTKLYQRDSLPGISFFPAADGRPFVIFPHDGSAPIWSVCADEHIEKMQDGPHKTMLRLAWLGHLVSNRSSHELLAEAMDQLTGLIPGEPYRIETRLMKGIDGKVKINEVKIWKGNE